MTSGFLSPRAVITQSIFNQGLTTNPAYFFYSRLRADAGACKHWPRGREPPRAYPLAAPVMDQKIHAFAVSRPCPAFGCFAFPPARGLRNRAPGRVLHRTPDAYLRHGVHRTVVSRDRRCRCGFRCRASTSAPGARGAGGPGCSCGSLAQTARHRGRFAVAGGRRAHGAIRGGVLRRLPSVHPDALAGAQLRTRGTRGSPVWSVSWCARTTCLGTTDHCRG